jgi:hypothetical protein
VSVHVIVLEAFGDPTNNRVGNLRWDTYAANRADQRRHGRMPTGERNAHARLTAEQAGEIRRRRRAGEKLNDLAAEFGVCFGTISKIGRGVAWNI